MQNRTTQSAATTEVDVDMALIRVAVYIAILSHEDDNYEIGKYDFAENRHELYYRPKPQL